MDDVLVSQIIVYRFISPVVSLIKKLYPHCLVLVGSRNVFKPDFTIKLY